MRILVTGGSGSFGSAFIRRAMDDPEVERVVCYSRGEYRQQQLAESLGTTITGDGTKFRAFIGDVRDYRRLTMAMKGVTHVVHAAALKIVPAGEYNPGEFIRTNVNGAMNVIEAAVHSGVKKVVALSSDKSTAPINLYGATKLCAEKAFVSANAYGGGGTKFSVVRYGNVTGSTGSVVPIWWKRARAREPLLVTDPTMTRFMMSLDQAVDLVLWAIANARGGEVTVPDLPSYALRSLADAVWMQATGKGYAPLELVGIRDGEKMHESMIAEDESPWTWHNPEERKYAISTRQMPEGWTKVEPGFRLRSDSGQPMKTMELMTILAELGWTTPPPDDQVVAAHRARG